MGPATLRVWFQAVPECVARSDEENRKDRTGRVSLSDRSLMGFRIRWSRRFLIMWRTCGRLFVIGGIGLWGCAMPTGGGSASDGPSSGGNETVDSGGSAGGGTSDGTADNGETTAGGSATTYTKPLTFFAIHGDPQHADVQHFQSLQAIVQAASSRGVKLSIQLTPQWVEMILAPGNEWMLEAFQGFLAAGHDYGGHHHQIDHDAAWDGYSNDPSAVTSTRDPGYLGDMEAHLAVVQQLIAPEPILHYSGGEPNDYPVGIPILFEGGQFVGTEAANKQPERIDYGGQPAWQMSMASLIVFGQPDNQALQDLYLQTPAGQYFGVATHPNDWPDFQGPIIAWFDFLKEQDPDGRHMRTLSEILDELGPP
ncbi:MAG: hypothetical protein D6788_03900 [Planctomycetota bacterium]|nr:MAG: hypothetical protein D6788_03900 [Planctomycetota bacterium]